MSEFKYTVVGIHPNEFDRDPDGATYVEWVEASDPITAAVKAVKMYEDREGSIVVAVFRGHCIDVLYDKGLSSG